MTLQFDTYGANQFVNRLHQLGWQFSIAVDGLIRKNNRLISVQFDATNSIYKFRLLN